MLKCGDAKILEGQDGAPYTVACGYCGAQQTHRWEDEMYTRLTATDTDILCRLRLVHRVNVRRGDPGHKPRTNSICFSQTWVRTERRVSSNLAESLLWRRMRDGATHDMARA